MKDFIEPWSQIRILVFVPEIPILQEVFSGHSIFSAA